MPQLPSLAPLMEQVSIKSLKDYYNITAVKVLSLAAIYNSSDVFDLNSYICRHLSKLLYSVESFIMIVEYGSDYNGAVSLARMIMDKTVVLRYIYDSNDWQQTLLRHCLFIIDGLNAKDSSRARITSWLTELSAAERKVVEETIKESDENREQIIQASLRLLTEHPYMKETPEMFEKLIRSGEWAFTQFPSTQKNGKFKHKKWETLYKEMGDDFAADTTSFYSQFVHGLAFSNIKARPTIDNFRDPMTEVIQMLKLIEDYLVRRTHDIQTEEIRQTYSMMEKDRKENSTETVYQALVNTHRHLFLQDG